MWYAIIIILIVCLYIFLDGFEEAICQLRLQRILNIEGKDGIIKICPAKLLDDITNIEQGKKVAICLYDDKITINKNIIIPLSRTKEAVTFKAHAITFDKSSIQEKRSILRQTIGTHSLLIDLFGKLGIYKDTRIQTFLSIQYINKEGKGKRGLFVSDNKIDIENFADDINKQIEINRL